MITKQSSPTLEGVKAVLNAFREQINLNLQDLQNETASLDEINYFKANCWLAGGISAEEFIRFNFPKTQPEFFSQKAQPLYEKWLLEEKDICYRGSIIPNPKKMLLNQYLELLFLEVLQSMEQRSVWLRSLRSFISFIRNSLPFEMRNSLELIFPEKMEIRKLTSNVSTTFGRRQSVRNIIIKKFSPSEYPIHYIAQSEIMENLAYLATDGRPNIRHSAAEALGLSWCCTICALNKLKTQERIIFNLPLKSLKRIREEGKDQFSLEISTQRGLVHVPISSGHYALLKALPRSLDSSRLFTKPLPSLLRTLYKAVEMSEKAPEMGKITFLTFMKRPVEKMHHRYPKF